MAWKEYAEEVANELKVAQDAISRLRRQLAERDEQLAIAINGGHQASHTKIHSQVVDLQDQLQEAREAKDVVAREAAQSRELFQNTLAKLTKVEKENHAEIQTLKNQLAGQENMLRTVQATRATDQAPTMREKQLKEQVEALKSEISTLKSENTTFKTRFESLSKQLQVGKTENLQRIASMKGDRRKGYEQDDDEDLPRYTTMVFNV